LANVWLAQKSSAKNSAQLLRFYYTHNSRSESLIKVGLEKFTAVLPITEDSAVIEPLAFVTKMRSASDVGMDARRDP
jgi:hypothetical protein